MEKSLHIGGGAQGKAHWERGGGGTPESLGLQWHTIHAQNKAGIRACLPAVISPASTATLAVSGWVSPAPAPK